MLPVLMQSTQVKNYYQRRLDSGQKDFEEILLIAEEKKARGEPTGPLPVPSVAPKRRYEATPSAIVPRTLAPQDAMMAEADEARFASKGKHLAMSPQSMPLHGRPLSESERGAGRFPTLAQASTAASVPMVAATLGDEASRAIRAQAGASHRTQGPRLGYFTEDRRESSILPHATPRLQDMQIPARHNPAMSADPLASQGYLSAQPPPGLLPSHSRHPSLTQAPSSPTQLPRPELDIPSVHRDPFGQRQYYPLPGQPASLAPSPRPVLSPVKDVPRPSATPAPESTPRQVPAKRSNIMSILNDEPEEPQPRKRFASEQSSPVPATGPVPRPGYVHTGSSRPEEPMLSGAAAKAAPYSQQSPYAVAGPPRGYADYSSYGPPPGGSVPSGNNDWMARFDPRAPQGGPPPQSSGRPAASMTTQSSHPYSTYAPTPSQQAASLSNLPAPSPAQSPPPGTQRSSYPNVFSQPPPTQPTGSRDLASQLPAYRPGSPPPRASSVAFGSRQEPSTPANAATSLFGLPPRQSGPPPSYSPAGPSTASPAQTQGQSYQQHVQTLVNGSHQSHRSASVGLPGGPPQYGRTTPPPQTSTGRSMPSLASLGRSYTPPSALHPTGSGMGYAPPPPSTSGPLPSLHQRPSGPGLLGDPASTPTHQRVFSQGSSQSGLPGPLPPSSQPPQ